MQYSDVGGSDIQIAAKSYLMELEINDGPKGWLLAVFSLVKPIVKEVEEKGIMLLIDGNLCAASVCDQCGGTVADGRSKTIRHQQLDL
jgi:hypothetical protein